MVNLGQLAVSLDINSGDGKIGVALDRQREDRGIVCLGASQRTNDYTSINGLGEREELDREVLLGLEQLQLA